MRKKNAARLQHACVWLLLAVLSPLVAFANNLPATDTVFVPSARAITADTIQLQWQIADGYYLYRHRTQVRSDDGSLQNIQLTLPPGTPHHDAFFGDVQTYRHQLLATIKGQPSTPKVRLQVSFQGCADIGICYPPQTQNITVQMPAAVQPLAAQPLLRQSLPGAGGLLGQSVNAQPLPEQQAFRFEAIADGGNRILMRISPAPGYYLYRDRSQFQLQNANGIRALPPQWPAGKTHHDDYFGEQVVYFDAVDIPLPLQRSHTNAVDVTLLAHFQGCQTDGICYPPMQRRLTLALPAGTLTPTDTPSATTAIAGAGADTDAGTPETSSFVSAADDADAAAATTPASATAGLPEFAAADLPATTGVDARTAAPAFATAAGTSLLWTLLLALLGGLILNLMPCVLPVLSLKAFALTHSGENAASRRKHAVFYTIGVLVGFAALGALALGLRNAGLALGWGFQLQQPAVVGALALVMLGLGLGLSGLWQLGGRWLNTGAALTRRNGASGDFFTGLLAVLVATPCTAPLMGAALAYAFTAPAVPAMLVFLLLGLGMALPFLLIGFVPTLANRLPRPGAWMEPFKQLLAFPMYLTCAWLLWVLAKQRGADAVGLWSLAAITLAFVLWALDKMRGQGVLMRAVFAMMALLALALPLQRIHQLPRQQTAMTTPTAASVQPGQTIAYSADTLAQLRQRGVPVFVNITADWCVTCKANERTVLSRPAFLQALQAAGAVYMVGDYTTVDPAITAFLNTYNAPGVPLYVLYPGNDAPALQLPVLLTPQSVDDALQQVRRRLD